MPVEDLAVHEPDYRKLVSFLKAMEFTTLTRRVAELADIDASQIEADARLSSGAPPLPPVRPEDGASRSSRRPAGGDCRVGQEGSRTADRSARPTLPPRPSQARGEGAHLSKTFTPRFHSPKRVSRN